MKTLDQIIADMRAAEGVPLVVDIAIYRGLQFHEPRIVASLLTLASRSGNYIRISRRGNVVHEHKGRAGA